MPHAYFSPDFEGLLDTDIDHPAKEAAGRSCEEETVCECSFSFNVERTIVTLDMETGNVVAPVFKMEQRKIIGSIFLVPGKKYYAFEVRSAGNGDCSMSDYEIGMAYRYGKYRLKRNEKRRYGICALLRRLGTSGRRGNWKGCHRLLQMQ